MSRDEFADVFPEAEAERLADWAASLRGTHVVRATYWGADRSLMWPGVHHNLLHVELALSDGRRLHVGWFTLEPDGVGYVDGSHLAVDLKAVGAPDPDSLERSEGLDASALEPWASLIGQAITDARFYWSWTRIWRPASWERPADAAEQGPDRDFWNPSAWALSDVIYFPQDLELRFASGPIIYLVSGAQMQNSDEFIPGEPPVNVVFDEGVADRLQAGPRFPDARTADKRMSPPV
jgi:hypothetical protein